MAYGDGLQVARAKEQKIAVITVLDPATVYATTHPVKSGTR